MQYEKGEVIRHRLCFASAYDVAHLLKYDNDHNRKLRTLCSRHVHMHLLSNCSFVLSYNNLARI